jgi:non-specific serine/threonine protein kinase
MATGTSYRTPGALPPQTSGFVGRVAELGRARELLRESRLVTVTGPGGVGKTRLAVRVASEAAAGFRDGARLIELSGVRDPGLLMYTVAAELTLAELSIAESDQGSQVDTLLGFIHDRELLLILDTCEHLVDACAALADTILPAAPGVTILATSRQPLDASGEAVLQLLPLPVPDPSEESAGKADVVELFAQRAAAAVPGFTVTPENLADIITVCRRLDGIPLAIELATVRLRALPLRQMAERIDDRLRLLTGGRRSGTPRHQTLRAAIEWSYSLCTPTEQLLWERLSVFAGGFDIVAAEAVCAGGELATEEILPTLISLVDKNVLVRERAPDPGLPEGGNPGEPAFRMLDTIREFGTERLHLGKTPAGTSQRAVSQGPAAQGPAGHGAIAQRDIAHRATTRAVSRRRAVPARREQRKGEDVGQAEAAVRRRFIAHYLALAELFEREPTTDQVGQYQRLRREHANLRAAFDYALGLPGNEGAAIVLATSLFVYWRISGLLREAEYWLDQALERCPKGSVVRARVLSTRGYVRTLLGDFANGRTDAEAAIEMAAVFSDLAAAGRAHSTLHRVLTYSGNFAEAQAAADAAASCLTSVGDTLALAQLDLVDALLRLQEGELDRCYESVTRGLDRLPEDEIWCTANLLALQSLGLFLRGDFDRAWPSARRSLQMQGELNEEVGIAFGLGTMAFIAAGQGRYERTTWLFGASAPLWERSGRWYTGAPAFEALHGVAERVARNRLGEDRFWELHAAGAAAPLDHAIERALGDDDQLGETAGHWAGSVE